MNHVEQETHFMQSLSTLNKELAANFWNFWNFSSRTTSEPPKPQLFSRTTFELYGLGEDQLATLSDHDVVWPKEEVVSFS